MNNETVELRGEIQQALGPRFVVERELEGGGMSRVFVATDSSLQRRVVVKVLPPDVSATISQDRFRREMTLAAQLQHPLVVPVLSSGELSNTLFYTMPPI